MLQILAEILSQGLKLEKGAKIGGYTKRSFIELSRVLRKRLGVKSNLEAIKIGLKKGWIDETKLPFEFIKTFRKSGKIVTPVIPTQGKILFLKELSKRITTEKICIKKSARLKSLRKALGAKTDSGVIVKAVKLGWIEAPSKVIEFCSRVESAKGKLTPNNIKFLDKIAQGLKEGKMLIEIWPETNYSTQGAFFISLARLRQYFGVSSVGKLIKLGQNKGWLKPLT